MADEFGRWVLTYNGELYNHKELRKFCESRGHQFRSSMDGEVILHLWEEQGEDALSHLNGIFALAIANTETGEVFLARDPVGVKPLYYVIDDCGTLWFASEIAALTTSGAPTGPHDLTALAQFLSFLWIPAPRTPYAGIKALMPGEVLRWNPCGTSRAPYTEPLIAEPESDDRELDGLTVEGREQFTAATRRQLLGDVPIGLMASGGIDSSLIWWAGEDGIDKAFTISWGRDSYGEGLDEDARAVGYLEDRFGTEVEFMAGEDAEGQEVPPSGDLFADPAYHLARLISRRARGQDFKVLLSGQGADELLAGYRRHIVAPMTSRLGLGRLGSGISRLLSQLPVQRVGLEYIARTARATSGKDPLSRYMELCTYSTAHRRAQILDCDEAEVANEVVWEQHRAVYERQPRETSALRKALAVDLNVYLPGLGLAYADRAGMEFGVEIRVPWLDLEFVRWALRLPEYALVRGREGKVMGKRIGEDALGRDLAYRSKRPFGAPISNVTQGGQVQSDTGFRQDYYVTRASEVLQGFLN